MPRPLREPAAQIYSAQRGRAISVVHFPNHRVTKAPYVTRIMGTRRIFEQMPGKEMFDFLQIFWERLSW